MTVEMTCSTPPSDPSESSVDYEMARSLMVSDLAALRDNINEYISECAEKYLGVALGAEADKVMLELLVEKLQEELGH